MDIYVQFIKSRPFIILSKTNMHKFFIKIKKPHLIRNKAASRIFHLTRPLPSYYIADPENDI